MCSPLYLRFTYASTVMGGPHVGEMTFAFDNDRYSAAFIDSFHTGDGVMLFVGDKGKDVVSVLGSYGPAAEPWGWRNITVSQPSADELHIDEQNILPTGEASPAVEMRLRRG